MAITLDGRSFVITPSDGVMNFRDPGGTGDFVAPGEVFVTQATRNIDEDAGTITVTAGRSGGEGAASVSYQTIDGSAEASTDYSSASGTLSWGDGDTSNKSVTISITDRSGEDLNDRSFDWQIHTPSGTSIRTNEDGSLQDTTRVTIRDVFDGASDEAEILWTGDFTTGDWSQWNNFFWGWPEYGAPEPRGNGELGHIVTSPSRGPNRPYSGFFMVKNGSNWSEPADCDGNNCDRRRSSVRWNGVATEMRPWPQFESRWITASIYIPSNGYWQGDDDRFDVYGWKGSTNQQGQGNLGSSAFNVQLSGPGGTWRTMHRFNPTTGTNTDGSWQYQAIYHSELPWDNSSWSDLWDDAPNINATKAAFGSVNLDGWTDWAHHVRADTRALGQNTGFYDLYKREDNGPWVHVLSIVPKHVCVGSFCYDRGVGQNVDEYWPAGTGLYIRKSRAQNSPNNIFLYITNTMVLDGSASLQAVGDLMRAGS